MHRKEDRVKRRRFLEFAILFRMTLLAGSVPPVAAQAAETGGTPVRMVVTTEARHGTDVRRSIVKMQ
jgi:hypothetical protein